MNTALDNFIDNVKNKLQTAFVNVEEVELIVEMYYNFVQIEQVVKVITRKRS